MQNFLHSIRINQVQFEIQIKLEASQKFMHATPDVMFVDCDLMLLRQLCLYTIDHIKHAQTIFTAAFKQAHHNHLDLIVGHGSRRFQRVLSTSILIEPSLLRALLNRRSLHSFRESRKAYSCPKHNTQMHIL